MSDSILIGDLQASSIAVKETESRALTSFFMYRFWLLKDAQSLACPTRSSMGILAFEVVEAAPLLPD
jgi:hypothetical protein